MAKTTATKQSKSVKTRYAGYEIKSFQLWPKLDASEVLEYEYNFNSQTRVNESKQLIFIEGEINILNKENKTKLGCLTAVSLFEIHDFNDVVTKKDGSFHTNEDLDRKLTVLTLNTMRGTMISLFSNTYLKNVLMPVIEEKMLSRATAAEQD